MGDISSYAVDGDMIVPFDYNAGISGFLKRRGMSGNGIDVAEINFVIVGS